VGRHLLSDYHQSYRSADRTMLLVKLSCAPWKGTAIPVGGNPTRHLSLRPEAIGAPGQDGRVNSSSVKRVTLGDLASVQAAT
jgi:hypothetical protein